MKTAFTIDGENKAVFENEHFSRGIRQTVDGKEPDLSELKYRYKVTDDDDVTYFWGRINNDSSFLPVDWIGVQYGAIHMYIKNKDGKYELL